MDARLTIRPCLAGLSTSERVTSHYVVRRVRKPRFGDRADVRDERFRISACRAHREPIAIGGAKHRATGSIRVGVGTEEPGICGDLRDEGKEDGTCKSRYTGDAGRHCDCGERDEPQEEPGIEIRWGDHPSHGDRAHDDARRRDKSGMLRIPRHGDENRWGEEERGQQGAAEHVDPEVAGKGQLEMTGAGAAHHRRDQDRVSQEARSHARDGRDKELPSAASDVSALQYQAKLPGDYYEHRQVCRNPDRDEHDVSGR